MELKATFINGIRDFLILLETHKELNTLVNSINEALYRSITTTSKKGQVSRLMLVQINNWLEKMKTNLFFLILKACLGTQSIRQPYFCLREMNRNKSTERLMVYLVILSLYCLTFLMNVTHQKKLDKTLVCISAQIRA